MQDYNVEFNPQQCSGTIIYVAKNNKYLGYVVVDDELKSDAKNTMQNLKNNQIKVIMLTGDNKATAELISFETGIDDYKFNLLPHEKVEKFESIVNEYKSVAFVGDGVNDTPVLSMAKVGFSMGIKGSDSAVEQSDVVIMNDNLSAVCDSIKIAKKTKSIAIQNIVFSLGIKLAIMLLGAFGLANMYLAIFADVGVSIIAILNAIRIFTTKLK
jgi:Cd2+/Zn2+-exporting ATPase